MEEAKQLCDWMAKGLAKPKATGMASRRTAQGDRTGPLPRGSSTVWVVPSFKLLPRRQLPRQGTITELSRKIQQLQSTRGGEKPAGGRGGEKSGGRGGEKPPSGSDRGGERQTGNWNGQQPNQPNQNRSATGFKPHNPDIICQSCGQKGHPSHKCPNKKAESSAAAARWMDEKQDPWAENPEMQAKMLEAFQAGMQARK